MNAQVVFGQFMYSSCRDGVGVAVDRQIDVVTITSTAWAWYLPEHCDEQHLDCSWIV